MRRFLVLALCLVAAPSAWPQARKMKLDSLGLPPLRVGKVIGQIRLPLADILKPEPGQKPTGPALQDLSIETYRTPLTVPVDEIASFYRKFAVLGGWQLLDDIQDSTTNRALVFWSASAPGYLTIEVAPGPNDTRQVDLTRLLGDVNPSRPGEVYKLTGKRVRLQHAVVTIAGRFLNLKTNQLVRRTVTAIESTSETGMGVSDAKWLTPMSETYAVAIHVTDSGHQMTQVEVFSGNNNTVARAQTAQPVAGMDLVAKVRATQGLNLHVSISGPDMNAPVTYPLNTASQTPIPPPAPLAANAKRPAPGTKAALGSFRSAKSRFVPVPVKLVPRPTPAPIRPVTLLTDWTLRPALTAMPEVRRGPSTTKTDSKVLVSEEEAGPACDGPLTREIPWTAETTDTFTFSPDLFTSVFPHMPVGTRTGTLNILFPKNSGESNKFTVSQATTTTTTDALLGYSFAYQWVKLPANKLNPETLKYLSVVQAQPTVFKRSTGACPPPPTVTPSAPITPAH